MDLDAELFKGQRVESAGCLSAGVDLDSGDEDDIDVMPPWPKSEGG